MPSSNKYPSFAGSATGARTSVTAANANTLLIAASVDRFGVSVTNDSDKTLYLGVGTAAVSATDYTVKVLAGGYWETPFSYSGQIRGLWESGVTGFARVTEYV